MIRVLIVDDEQLARSRLQRLLAEVTEETDIKTASSGQEAIEIFDHFKPQILFLDVQMPGMSGFDLLYQLPDEPFQVIFQTAYEEFAVQAFDVNAIDYLLKPFNSDRLKVAFERALASLNDRDKYGDLKRYLRERHCYMQELIVSRQNTNYRFAAKKIVWAKSSENYVEFMIEGRNYLSRMTIEKLVSTLDPKLFFQIQRGLVVSRDFISGYRNQQDVVISMKSGDEFSVSRRRKKDFLDWIASN